MEHGSVTSLIEEKGVIKGVKYKTKDGQELVAYAPLTIVCDGCFSKLRSSISDPKVCVSSWSVGLILENCQLPQKNHVHLFLGESSSFGLYEISSTEVRCIVNVAGQKPPSVSNGEMENYMKTVVAPHMLPQIRDAFLVAVEKGNTRIMPNQSMPANPHPTPGALLIGDALNMRHFVTGGGMTVALSDVVLLRDLLRPLHKFPDPQTLSQYLESFYTLRKPMSSTLNIFADVIYQLFFTKLSDQGRKDVGEAGFEFLSLGELFLNLAVELHSGLNPRPLRLLFLFFGMSAFVVGRSLLPYPSPTRIWRAAILHWVSIRLLFPLIWAEGVRQTYLPATLPVHFLKTQR